MASLVYTTAHPIPHVNPIFPLRYDIPQGVHTIMNNLKIQFAPGLREVLLSETPPSLGFFKTLPMPPTSE